jgi:hypothetical protein
VTFDPPSGTSRVDGVGVDVKGSDKVHIIIPVVFGQFIPRTIHALYTLDMSCRTAQRIGCLLNVSWMQAHSGCEFIFPTDFDNGLLMVLA